MSGNIDIRTIWGQSFDGTQNVSGPMYFNTANYAGMKDGYLSLNTRGNEITVSGTSDTNIYVNYRKSLNGYAPATWYWMKGDNVNYANFYIGELHAAGGTMSGNILASTTNTYDIGSSSSVFRNIYATTFNGALNW
jgi:hypothetical protein